HRLLMITPFEGQMPSESPSDGIWIKPAHLKDYGLPKPLEIYLNGNRLE
ncbi:TPA: A/G-specific adenine glycosylase, partial [Neisseria meningitidis]